MAFRVCRSMWGWITMCQIPVRAGPDRRVAWIAMRQCALHELPRHERRPRVASGFCFISTAASSRSWSAELGSLGLGLGKSAAPIGFLVLHVCMKNMQA